MFILWLLKNEGERDRASKVIFLSFYENVVKAMNLFPRKTQICIFWHVSFFKKCTLLERTPQAFYLKGLNGRVLRPQVANSPPRRRAEKGRVRWEERGQKPGGRRRSRPEPHLCGQAAPLQLGPCRARWQRDPDATARVSSFSRENPSLDFGVKCVNA